MKRSLRSPCGCAVVHGQADAQIQQFGGAVVPPMPRLQHADDSAQTHRHGVGKDNVGRQAPMTTETYEILAVKYAERTERFRAESFIIPAEDDHATPHPMDYFVWVIRN